MMKQATTFFSTTIAILLCWRPTAGFLAPTHPAGVVYQRQHKISPLSASILSSPDEPTNKVDAEFTVGVLGDLHMDPRDMEDYAIGREHLRSIFEKASHDKSHCALVSLGDLGESKPVHEDNPELFSGTTECHEMAAEYLGSFGVPYEVVGGNHDLEGIDEFATDEENLEMMLKVHNKPTPQFIRKIADKTLLVGLTSTVFRDAKYTSHEVTIDQEQLEWFEDVVTQHPSADGWKIFVFTHAPPLGSGLKVLPDNHVVNGCCWLNHSNEQESTKFIELVRKHRCIKAWFSGHFHLGQNYQDSITFPEKGEGRGSCVFVQTSVMRSGTSRDGSQQSRLIRGNENGFEICTIDHQKEGKVRLDAIVTYSDCDHEVGVYAEDCKAKNEEDCEPLKVDDKFVQVYVPNPRLEKEEDAPYPSEDDRIDLETFVIKADDLTEETSSWWRLANGRVLGLFQGMLLEYDPSTLSPLGLVVGADELLGKSIAVIDVEDVESDADAGETGDDDNDGPVQAVVLIDEHDGRVVVVQPNEDGSYWRKIVRNKLIRMREKRREEAAADFAKKLLAKDVEEVVSTWGPYKSTSGTAKETGVVGITVPHEGPDCTSLVNQENSEILVKDLLAPYAPTATSTTTLDDTEKVKSDVPSTTVAAKKRATPKKKDLLAP